MEAGGHIGRLTTMALLPQVTEAVSLPVIAAGGFGDGRSLAAAIMLGAAGIQVGTRFVVAEESNAHDNFKKAILKANDLSTVVTGEITGHPVRVLRNQLTQEYLTVEKSITSDEEPDFTELEELGAGALRRAVVEGDTKSGSMMAGQIAGLVKEEQTVKEIILDYVNEAEQVYEESKSYFE
jgi:enoyl-[acyl-carrier protein] reductase II